MSPRPTYSKPLTLAVEAVIVAGIVIMLCMLIRLTHTNAETY